MKVIKIQPTQIKYINKQLSSNPNTPPTKPHMQAKTATDPNARHLRSRDERNLIICRLADLTGSN